MDTTQEYRDLTEQALIDEIKAIQELVGPGQLATIISTSITDTQYLKEFVQQITNNLVHGR